MDAGNGGNVQDTNDGNVNSTNNTSSEGPIVVDSTPVSGSDPGGQPTSEPVAVQELFKIILDSMIRVRLPPDLKLYDNGSAKKCQPVYNVVHRCACYTDPILNISAHCNQIFPRHNLGVNRRGFGSIA